MAYNTLIDYIMNKYLFEQATDELARIIEQDILRTFPADYTIKCSFAKPNQYPHIELWFADSEEAIVFKLRYG